MPYQSYSLADLIVDNLFNIGGLFSRPYKIEYMLAMKRRKVSSGEFGQTIKRMQDRKLIAISYKNSQKFIKLTKKGQLQALLEKSKLEKPKVWDYKWRLFIFDIPEASKDKREIFRSLLKRNNFLKLQASVYISPYPLNREAIDYLNQSGLRDYIRILKVEEMDSDKELLKKFNLKK